MFTCMARIQPTGTFHKQVPSRRYNLRSRDPPLAPSGFVNPRGAHVCYLNALIQCVRIPLTEWWVRILYPCGVDSRDIDAATQRSVFADDLRCRMTRTSSADLRPLLTSFDGRFTERTQHDPVELWSVMRNFIDQLEKTDHIDTDTCFSQSVGLYMTTRRQCRTCSAEVDISSTQELIRLVITPASSLQQLLDQSDSPTRSHEFKCPSCHGQGQSTNSERCRAYADAAKAGKVDDMVLAETWTHWQMTTITGICPNASSMTSTA